MYNLINLLNFFLNSGLRLSGLKHVGFVQESTFLHSVCMVSPIKYNGINLHKEARNNGIKQCKREQQAKLV